MRALTSYRIALAAVILFTLAACEQASAPPEPRALTRAAVGHYCNMIVVDHSGPKAQVHESGQDEPLWFSSVRDGLAYLALPGEAQSVIATYVHDMGRTDNWDRPPDDGIWIKAQEAHYVIGSKRRGGMGAQEAVPFGTVDAAKAFIDKYGGRVVSFADIPRDYIVGDANDHREPAASPGTATAGEHHEH